MYKFPGTHRAPKLTQEGIENVSSTVTKDSTSKQKTPSKDQD